MPVVYPLDTSGVNPTNLVQGELHSVSGSKLGPNNFLVPDFAPFYIDNFKAKITVGSDTRDLVEDVDYSFALPYVTGTRTTGKAMYGGVTLHNLSLSGIITLERYQTIGGDQVADKLAVLTLLADKAYNPRTTIWDILTNVPNALPPVPNHYQDYAQFYGQEQLVGALLEIRDAILQNSSLTQEQITQFLQTINAGALSTFMKRTGDTMTGPLTLYGPPMSSLQAATKQYVDENTIDATELASYMSRYHTAEYLNTKLAEKLDKAGGALTGHITLSADPVQAMHPTSKQYVDNVKTNIDAQLQSMSDSINNLSSGHVTQEYVDSRIAEVLNYIHTLSLGSGR